MGELLKSLRSQCSNLGRNESKIYAKKQIKTKGNHWKFVNETLGKKMRSTATIKKVKRSLSANEASNQFNKHFKEKKIINIVENIPQHKGDPLTGAKMRAKKLMIKLGKFSFKTISEKDTI